MYWNLYIWTRSGQRAAAHIMRTRLDAVEALGIEGAQAVEVGGRDRLEARPEQLEHRVPVEVEHRDGHRQSLVGTGRGANSVASAYWHYSRSRLRPTRSRSKTQMQMPRPTRHSMTAGAACSSRTPRPRAARAAGRSRRGNYHTSLHFFLLTDVEYSTRTVLLVYYDFTCTSIN